MQPAQVVLFNTKKGGPARIFPPQNGGFCEKLHLEEAQSFFFLL
jgi:hypothetical protein